MCKKFIALLLVFTLIGTFGFSPSVFADTVVGSSDNGDGTYTNPVIWADVPDQDVIRVGDTYYMSSTTMHMCPGVPIMKSYDLINWETISYCYLVLDDSDATTLKNGRNMYGNGTWASSLKYKDGTFYVVVPSPTTNKTYIFQTEDPENQPWRRYEINARYHDCSLLLDDDGRNWLVYGNNPLYIIELNETVTGVKEGASPRVLIQNIHAPDPITGVTPTSGLAEGAHIQKINGKYYIFCITWPSGKPRTEVCHRGDSLDGPFEAKTVAQENIIIGGQGGGPAQGNIVDDGKGNWYGFLFRDSGAVGRIPWVMPIHWSDGWPMFGDDDTGLHLTRGGPKPIQGDFELKSVVTSDEFDNNAKKPTYNDAPLTPAREEYAYNGSNLKLEWQWNHNPDNRYWSLTERPGWLRLTTGQMATNLLDARNTLTQRTIGPVSSVQTKLDVSNMKNGDRAGLALFTAQYGTIEVRMDDDVKTLVMVNSSSTTTHNDVESIPLPTDIIYLKVDADFRNQTDKGTFYYSFDGVNWVQLGNTQQMVYSINNHFMGYRFALYNFATKNLGGYVDFDYYRISDTLEGSNVDLSLKDLQINGSQVAGFNPNTKTYDIRVPIGAVPPTVTAVANDSNVEVSVTQADTVPGKATVTVSLGLLEDVYTINFVPDLSLKDIKVDGISVAGFSPDKYLYSVSIPPESGIPEVTAVPNDPNATVTITQPTEIPGRAIVTVSSGDMQTVYTVMIRYAASGGGNVVWYEFDESDGAVAIDSSGNGKDATIIGATGPRVEGRFGNALRLQSSSNQYVRLPNGIVSDLGDFTIATWINPSTMATWARIFDFGNDTNTNMFLTLRASSNNQPRFAIKVNGSSEQQLTAGSGFTLSANTWHHIAITKSGNTARMYLNGRLAATNNNMTFNPKDMGITTNNWIGRSQYSADPYLNGIVDDFSIYDYALSQEEIQLIMTRGVVLDKSTMYLTKGSTGTLTAKIVPSSEITFTSSNPDVVKVTGAVFNPAAGTTSVTVNALAEGTATITAATKDGSETATCIVTVNPANELIVNGGFENGINPWIGNDSATISLSNQDPYSGSNCLFTTGRTTTGGGPRQNLIFEVIPGHTYQVSAKVKYVGDAYPASKQFNFCITCDTERSDYWSSIRIMASANITKGTWGTISGTYQIAADEKISNPYIFIETVYASSPSATEDLMDFYVDDISLVDITAPPYVAVEGVTLDADTLNLKEGESRQLVATVVPENATNKNVIWESDNTGVATVDSTGKVTAVAAGTATIMVTTVDGSKTAACTVTVTPEAEVPTAALTASGSVQPGATFTAGISLDNLSSGVYAEDILLSYDADVFEYVGTTGANDNIKVLREDASAPGTVRLIAANIGGVSGASTPVLNVSFKVKAGVENTTGSIAVTSAKLGVPDGSIIEAGLSSKVITIGGGTPGVDKSQLITAINNAQTLYDNAEVGTEPGQYPQAAKDALKAAIDAAKAVRDDSSATQSQVDDAVTALNNAVNIFKAAVVEEAKPDINDDGIIDVADLGFVAYYYGKECTGTEWQVAKATDMNGDGKIDIEDLAYVANKISD